MKKQRSLYLHSGTNKGKIRELELLHSEYLNCVRLCVETLIDAQRFTLFRSEKKHIFNSHKALTSNIKKCAQEHAVAKVSAWASKKYSQKLKDHINDLCTAGWIDESFHMQLCTIGKHSINKPWEFVTQEAINFYWNILRNVCVAGKPPKVSDRDGMYMTSATSSFDFCEDNKLTKFWIRFAYLTRYGRWIKLPVVENPYVTSLDIVGGGIFVYKTKKGRWCFQVVEKQIYKLPNLPKNAPSIGIDVGQNVLVTTSNGDLYGTQVKPRYLKHRNIIQNIRANRARQGLEEDSDRVNTLDTKLTAYMVTETRTATNKLIKKYPGYRFAVEDLHLTGVSGDRRFGDSRVINDLKTKAHTITVNPAYTSQECPSCGYVSRRNRHGTKFQCRSCGRVSHADVVGAINVLRRSKDKQIDCDDNHKAVGSLLRERYLRKRNSSLKGNHAPPSYGQKLTVGSGNTSCTASNLVANSQS